ncbi:ornithine cyclodeaminase family protein [Bradyrhizobium sp. Leo170]|uniref:ornithine cyclodeaminase family protein n=1 Tax=Bradyrhizobium sp. Leo170 TaxID=1571199 RepID=UPI00102E5B9D|nr:ornithine cyclodeaminase family protein [Bradyrhizobium sp. Leo170]TAI66988.1 ornithine cyclodeaminase family protein [Bradyrhizobium sp. Leo170]
MTEKQSLQTIDAKEATRLLPMDELIRHLRTFFVGGCTVPPRHHHTIPVPGEPDATLLLMPSWQQKSEGDDLLGIKLVAVFPGNAARKMPALTSVYLLFDSGTGAQLATVAGDVLTARRTAATSALAASYLAREDATNLLILGSGRIASLLPEAYRAVRDIRRISVWNVNADSAVRMVDRLRNAGLDAVFVSDLERAVRTADIVTSATLATSPLIKGEWLQAGVHVDLIGAFTPAMRESDDDVVKRSAIFVDTYEAAHEAGDLVHPIEAGILSRQDLKASLAELCSGAAHGRRSRDDITMFKAVGTALADLAAAGLAYKTRIQRVAHIAQQRDRYGN